MKFFLNYLRGNRPLWETFWIMGILHNILIQFMLYLGIRNDQFLFKGTELKVWVFTTITLGGSIYLSWFVSTWRSAKNSKKLWKIITRIVLILSLGINIRVLFFIFSSISSQDNSEVFTAVFNSEEIKIEDLNISLDKELEKTRSELPMLVGENILLNSVVRVDNSVIFLYTIKDINLDHFQGLRHSEKIKVIREACQSELLSPLLLKHGFTIEYKYQDKLNNIIETISIRKNDCIK